MVLGRSFASFQHRNFRLFWGGQCVSLVGTWMQTLAQAWLVLTITDSAFLLGVVGAAQFLPMLLLSLFAGTLIDRFPKRRMLMFTQSASLVLAGLQAVMVFVGFTPYWSILVLALLLGCINTLDVPARQSFVIELVGRDDLTNAISLNSAAFNLTRIVGPALGGILIASLGIGFCFLINAVSFAAVLFALSRMDVPDKVGPQIEGSTQGVLANVKDGLKYMWSVPGILLPIVLLALVSTFVINYSVLVPIFARTDLLGDASHFGFLMTSMGIGSFLAAMTLALFGKKRPHPLVFLASSALMSLFLALCGLQNDFLLSCILLGLTGFFTIAFTAQCNARLQLDSEDHMRGRVMSIYALAFGGVSPIGNLWAGGMIGLIGTGGTMFVSGVIGIAITGLVAFYLLSASRRAL